MVPQMGTGSSGDGADAVRVATVLGDREGPVGSAWATAIATPSVGHSPFVVVARPNLPVVPFTLFVPALDFESRRQAELTLGAGQAGVAAAVLDLEMDDPDGLVCLVASVSIGPDASDEDAIYLNTRAAAIESLQLGAAGGPWHRHLAEVDEPENAFFRRSGRVTPGS